MKNAARVAISSILISIFFLFSVYHVSAQTDSVIQDTKTASTSIQKLPSNNLSQQKENNVLGIQQTAPGEPQWVIDPEVTQVGRNAERARQLIYWVVTKPPIFSAPVLAQTWTITRNIAYILTVFVLIGLALQLILSRKMTGPTFSGISIGLDRVTIASILIRILAILIFITFSYILVRGLIQGSEILSNFFIERLGGQDLFNIVFSGANNESNYDFVGYKNADPLEQDMVYTSLFLIRATSFTYNFMSIILILRHIILMFLLIVSPFLALLLPYIFIRNTGWIWIGEFFRWLFYGPLFAIFIASLARIWKAGIPYQFDFTRAKSGEMVYHTGINILYGGPAQVLSPTNTANYVDTYAEYIIALIMLWTAILLPWLLLRIFRDYCCDILQKNQAVLTQILDKIRYPTPPKPSAPKPPALTRSSTFGRFISTTQKSSSQERINKEKIIEKINTNTLHTVDTRDIARAYHLQVRSLKDVAQYETMRSQKTLVQNTLRNIQNPYRVANPVQQKHYEAIRNEFTKRANQGDILARKVIEAATPRASQIKKQITSTVSSEELKQAIHTPGTPIVIKTIKAPSQVFSHETISHIAQKTHIEEEKIKEVLKELPIQKLHTSFSEDEIHKYITAISEKLNIASNLIQKIIAVIATAHHIDPTKALNADSFIQKAAQETGVPTEKIRSVMNDTSIQQITMQRERELAEEERIKQLSQRIQITKDQIRTIIQHAEEQNKLKQEKQISPPIAQEIAKETNLSISDVEKVLDSLPTVETKPQEEKEEILAQQTNLSKEAVKKIIDIVSEKQTHKKQEQTPQVSLEEYDEIRNMWIHHYRESDIPTSETIKSRKEWVREDVAKLSNTLELLISPNEKDRQKGLQMVEDLLPFLLLGGFSDVEMLTYLKAKLEAAKFIQEQLDREEHIRKQAEKKQEEMVVIPAVQPQKTEGEIQRTKAKAIPLPTDTDDKEKENRKKSPKESPLPGFHQEKEENKTPVQDPKIPDLPFKPKNTIIDPKDTNKLDT